MLREKKQFSENKTYDGNYKLNRHFRDKVGKSLTKNSRKDEAIENSFQR